jgi:hypothetical protein
MRLRPRTLYPHWIGALSVIVDGLLLLTRSDPGCANPDGIAAPRLSLHPDDRALSPCSSSDGRHCIGGMSVVRYLSFGVGAHDRVRPERGAAVTLPCEGGIDRRERDADR